VTGFVPSTLPRRIEHVSGRVHVPGWRINADGRYFFDLPMPGTVPDVRVEVDWRTLRTRVADVDRLGRTGGWAEYEYLVAALRFYGWHR
jgi:hypothetical protein